MEFALLIKALGEKVGLPELAPEDDGTCRLVIDGMSVDMKATGDGRHILLFGEIAKLPQEKQDELVRQMLGGNFLFCATGGATLGLDVQSQTVYLQQQEALAVLDDVTMATLLENFISVIENWRDIIVELQQGKVTTADISSDGGFAADLTSLRV